MQINSESEYFSGGVTIPDQLDWPGYLAWEDAMIALDDHRKNTGRISGARFVSFFIAPLCDIVTEWQIANMPSNPCPENFPLKPLPEVVKLLTPIIDQIIEMVTDLQKYPNS